MIRAVVATLFFLFVAVSGASAQTPNCVVYPNNLMNGTNADATQVMGNFAYILPCVRDRLTAARTYYVRTDGNDACNGLTNAAGSSGACGFLTIQKAINTVAALDLSIFNVTIQVADGTYTGAVVVNGPWLGSGTVTLQGDITTPANCIISVTGTSAITVQNRGALTVQGFDLVASIAGLLAESASSITVSGLMVFGSAVYQIRSVSSSVILFNSGVSYTINGSATYHYFASSGGSIAAEGITVAVTGTPAFATAFAFGGFVGQLIADTTTFSGSATGPRYSASNNGVIFTNGGGANYFPGNAAGSAVTGGQYN